MGARLAPWLTAIALVAGGPWAPNASAQVVTTQAVGGSGGTAFSLRCPTNTVLIGIRGKSGIVVDSIRGVCSQYNALGRRIGTPVETASAGGAGGFDYERLCPNHDAAHAFTAEASTVINSLAVQCSTVESSGLTAGTTSVPPGGPVGTAGTPGITAVTATCASRKFAIGIAGRAGGVVDQLAFACNVAALAATGFGSVKFNDPAGISGTAEMGTIALDGYALSATTVNLAASGAPSAAGFSVNPSVTIPAGASNAAFQLSTPETAAGCAFVEATAFGTRRTAQFVITPPPPATAGFNFGLVSAPADLTYTLTMLNPTRDIPARISLGTATRPIVLAAPATYRLASNHSGVTVPASVTIPAGSSAVNFAARASAGACAVITATSPSGTAIRKALRVIDSTGGIR